MLRAIVDKKRIAKIQNSFKKKMINKLRKSCMLNFGHKGDNITIKAYHDNDFWFASELCLDKKYYWNVFGLCPIINRSNNNIVQINVPCKGINRLIAGFLAEDVNTKTVYLMHRGKVGGGRKGIGKTAFVSWYKVKARTVDERDGRSSKAFLVTAIHDPHIANKVIRFVQHVARFKLLNVES